MGTWSKLFNALRLHTSTKEIENGNMIKIWVTRMICALKQQGLAKL